MTINQQKLDTLVASLLGELSAGYGGVMVSLGDKLGLYRAMAGGGPLSSHEVARRSGCRERYVREWLNSQVAGRYVDYHAASATYELTPEQAALELLPKLKGAFSFVFMNEETLYAARDPWGVRPLALGRLERAASDTARKRQVAEVVGGVAARLGNTPAVCRRCYIHPGVVDAYMAGKVVDRGSARLRESRMSADEAAVLAFLRRLSRSRTGARPR